MTRAPAGTCHAASSRTRAGRRHPPPMATSSSTSATEAPRAVEHCLPEAESYWQSSALRDLFYSRYIQVVGMHVLRPASEGPPRHWHNHVSSNHHTTHTYYLFLLAAMAACTALFVSKRPHHRSTFHRVHSHGTTALGIDAETAPSVSQRPASGLECYTAILLTFH